MIILACLSVFGHGVFFLLLLSVLKKYLRQQMEILNRNVNYSGLFCYRISITLLKYETFENNKNKNIKKIM